MSDDGYDDYLDRDDDDGFDPDGDEPEFDEYEIDGNLALQIAGVETGGFRQLGDVLDEVILACGAAYLARGPEAVVVPMIRPRVEPPTNVPDEELLFFLCQGQPPIRQKAIVVKMRAHDKIAPETAELVINALGLGGV